MNDIKKGILFAVLGPLFYSLRSLMIKLSPSVAPEVFTLGTTLFSFLFFMPLFIKHRPWKRPKKLSLFFIRSILGIPTVLCSVYGFQHLNLSDAILIENSMPIFILLLVLLKDRKRVSFLTFFLIGLGFCGLFFLLRPQLDIFQPAAMASLGAAIFGSLISMMMSYLTKVNNTATILFYTYLFTIPLYMLVVVFNRDVLNFTILGYIVITAVCVFAFQYSLVRSHALLSPHIVGGFVYLGVLFSAAFDWVIWGNTMGKWQVLGGGIVILSGFLILKENQYYVKKEVSVR